MPKPPAALERVLERVEPRVFRALAQLPAPVVRRLAGPPVELDGQTLDLQTQWMLRLKELVREPAAESLPIPDGRRAIARQARLVGGRQPIGQVRDLEVAGAEGPLAARLYVPRAGLGPAGPDRASGSPLLFFMHGGGMIYGDLDSYDPLCRFLAEEAGVRVLSVDYRLAPEHRFPAGVEDCWAAYQWASEHADLLGADPERFAVGGDSAGAYLSAVLAHKAAGAGVPLKWQLLLYPVTDMAEQSESRRLFGEGFFLTTDFIELAKRSYLNPHDDPRDQLVSVAYTEKIAEELAPAYVVTAGFDPLRDEGEAYAAALAEAGASAELRRFPGLIHGFANMVGVEGASRAAMLEVAGRLRAAL